MLKPYFLPILLAIIFTSSTLAQAQDYRPFHPTSVHYFTGTPNLSLRVDSVGTIGADSVFWMNEIAVLPPQSCTTSMSPPHFIPHQEGHFGDRFILRAGGQIDFLDRGGDTLFIETQASIGQSWSFQASNPLLTATLSARFTTTVLGSLDSVITIDLSDGQQFQLSKSHGLVSGPCLSHYFRAANLQPLSLVAVQGYLHVGDVFAWQPGDFYGEAVEGVGGLLYPQSAYWYTIMNRWESPGRDTLRLARYVRMSTYYPPSGPGSVGNPYNDTLVVVQPAYWYLNYATGEVGFDSTKYVWMQPWEYVFNGRIGLRFNRQLSAGFSDGCGYYPPVPSPWNEPYPEAIAIGLGTYHSQFGVGFTTTTEFRARRDILCYQIGGMDSLMPCPGIFDLVPVTEALPNAKVWIQGNGASSDQTLAWQGLRPGVHRWQVLDMHGRTCAQGQQWMDAAGSMRLPELGAAGLYVVAVDGDAGSWRAKFIHAK